MPEKIERCPHCGSTRSELRHAIANCYSRTCLNCGSCGPMFSTEKAANEAWNDRPIEGVLRGELADVRKELELLQDAINHDAGEALIHSMDFHNGNLNVVLSHPVFYLFTKAFSDYWIASGAKNYLEIEMASARLPGRFVIRFEKIGGKAPNVQVQELRAELEQARKELEAYKARDCDNCRHEPDCLCCGDGFSSCSEWEAQDSAPSVGEEA